MRLSGKKPGVPSIRAMTLPKHLPAPATSTVSPAGPGSREARVGRQGGEVGGLRRAPAGRRAVEQPQRTAEALCRRRRAAGWAELGHDVTAEGPERREWKLLPHGGLITE